MVKPNILVLARPTHGDAAFYSRWKEIGNVYTSEVPAHHDTFKAEEIDILVVDQHFTVNDRFIECFDRLSYVCSATTGHTHLQFDADKLGIKLITLRGETDFLSGIRSVAEFTIYLMLRLSRPALNNHYGNLLDGKTLGIVGLGRIGKQVRSLAKAFGMNVLSIDKWDSHESWEIVFKHSDIISVHLSEDESTRGIIGKTFLNLMKPTALFINTARGSVVDEHELAFMLNHERIAAAAVDVIENKDVLKQNTLNLIYTHHSAGSCIESRIATDEFIVNKLRIAYDAHPSSKKS